MNVGRWLDSAPLVAFVRAERAPIETLWPKGCPDYRAYYRAQKDGRISTEAADRLCISRGIHPYFVFGDEWFA